MEFLDKDVTTEFRTHFHPHCFNYQWHVGDIRERLSKETSLSTPEFQPIEDWTWTITLTTKGENQYIQLLFSMCPSHRCQVNLKITFANIRDGPNYRPSIFLRSFKTNDRFYLPTRITVSKLPKFTTLHFSMNFTHKTYYTEVYEKVARTTSTRLHTLSNDLSKLLDSGLASDVTFVLRGCEVHAHKAILCARSKKLSQMIQNRTIVEIYDMESHIFKYILKFLYSGTLSDIYLDEVEALYDAAIHYEIPALEKLCRRCLCSELTVNNAASIYRIAVKHKDQKWMKDIWDIMNFYIKTATHSWQTLVYKDPNLYESILRDIYM